MQQNYLRNAILLALAGVAIGATGIVAYYQQPRWLFIVCTLLSIAQLVLSLFFEPMKDEMYSYLGACLVVGYYLTDSIPDAACFGICFHYATAFIFSMVLSFISVPIVLIVVPVGGVVAYFLNAEHLFMVLSTFCFIYFLVKHFRGKNAHFAMDVFLWSATFGVSFLFLRNTDTYTSVKILKGLLWGSATYYIVMAIYAFYCVRHNIK